MSGKLKKKEKGGKRRSKGGFIGVARHDRQVAGGGLVEKRAGHGRFVRTCGITRRGDQAEDFPVQVHITRNRSLPSWSIFGQYHQNLDRLDLLTNCQLLALVWEPGRNIDNLAQLRWYVGPR